ncbi:beta-arabinofuranosyltransferase RAY1 isoform X2 [Magnolia sinica]|uniref:beta-arabinofuranosyltransferase RAY1 isoform X2 n=1 Tax=Magnolia sinica TaxID=86752 RepID=UPI002658BD11|nr:beta-arabinofuranosyltransferase RAY1 isoform X2 [Magnolia sinica]
MRSASSLFASLGYYKASQVGLWSVWLSGFLLISLSLYASQRLPSPFRDHNKRPKVATYNGSGDSAFPSVTIFSAPSPFVGSVGARQALAVRSWLALSPDVVVVLFGQHPSILSFATTLASRVLVESTIDFTFLGTPFYHSMVARSRASSSDIAVLIDPETILLPDFISALHYTHKLHHDWLLVARPRNVSHFPFHLDDTGKHWLQEDGKQIKIGKLREFVIQKQRWSYCGSRVLLAWNTGELPLHAGVLPPFLYGKGLHDQWVINEALSSEIRLVFDASESISSFYPESMGLWSDQFSRPSELGADFGERIWEFDGNSHLATLYGTLYLRPTNISNNLVKLVKCGGKYLFINVAEIAYNTFQGPDVHNGRLLPSSGKEQGRYGLLRMRSIVQSGREKLMACIKDSIAGNSYRDMLMSWVCRLRRLSISNFIVCALDPEIYHFAILQGLPVFKDPLAPSNISFNDCHFGTKCFQRVTKVKSRLVLQILKLGYDVLLSDVDVYWFNNPMPFLRSFGPAVLVAQSDEYKVKAPINLPRRLNSGFYFARSDHATIAAMSKVVTHALSSDLSEQPSFYDVLCGEGGVNRIGDDRCFEPETNLTVHFLDRNHFPNGGYQGLWEKRNVTAACMKKGCIVLHNNWISGRKKKLKRQVLSGLWEYDASTRMCLQSWHGTKSTICF